jgi:hypothetical protein
METRVNIDLLLLCSYFPAFMDKHVFGRLQGNSDFLIKEKCAQIMAVWVVTTCDLVGRYKLKSTFISFNIE